MSWWQIGAVTLGQFTESAVIYKKEAGVRLPVRTPTTSNGKRGAIMVRSLCGKTGDPLVSVHYGTNLFVNFNASGNAVITPAAGSKVLALASSLSINDDLEIVYLQ